MILRGWVCRGLSCADGLYLCRQGFTGPGLAPESSGKPSTLSSPVLPFTSLLHSQLLEGAKRSFQPSVGAGVPGWQPFHLAWDSKLQFPDYAVAAVTTVTITYLAPPEHRSGDSESHRHRMSRGMPGDGPTQTGYASFLYPPTAAVP